MASARGPNPARAKPGPAGAGSGLYSITAAAPLAKAVMTFALSVVSSAHSSLAPGWRGGSGAGAGANCTLGVGAVVGDPFSARTILPFTSTLAYSSSPFAGAEMPYPTNTTSPVAFAPAVDAESTAKL